MRRHLSVLAGLLALCAWPIALSASDTRSVSGTLSYHERIALPDGSLLMVEALDHHDRVVAALRLPTGGAQVPFDFALDLPRDQDLLLRAGLRWPDGRLWLSLPRAIAADGKDRELGELRARPVPAMGYASLLRCGDTLLEFGIVPDGAQLRAPGGVHALSQAPAASGALFVDPDNPETSIWLRAAQAQARIEGAELPECRLAVPQDDLVRLWSLTTIEGSSPAAPERAELGFMVDGRLSASVGCNRMVGSFERHGGMLRIERIATTLMACPEALALDEARLTALLAEVDGYHVDDARKLVLTMRGKAVLGAVASDAAKP